jgi:hypothetical protein
VLEDLTKALEVLRQAGMLDRCSGLSIGSHGVSVNFTEGKSNGLQIERDDKVQGQRQGEVAQPRTLLDEVRTFLPGCVLPDSVANQFSKVIR